MFTVSGIHYKAPSSSITKLPNDCWDRLPPKILWWYTFVLNWVPLNVAFHLRLVIWTIAYSQGDLSITFSIVSYSDILFQYQMHFPSCLKGKVHVFLLSLCNTQCVKKQIVSLNYSTSLTAFLLPYLFLRLTAIKQIFTNAGSWDVTLHEYKCIPQICYTKCFLFKVMGRKEIDIYWMLTVCQQLYIFISI